LVSLSRVARTGLLHRPQPRPLHLVLHRLSGLLVLHRLNGLNRLLVLHRLNGLNRLLVLHGLLLCAPVVRRSWVRGLVVWGGLVVRRELVG
jgi:hypothetical protein